MNPTTRSPSGPRAWRPILMLVAVNVLLLQGVIPAAQAQLNPGDILVIDIDAGTEARGALFRVTAATGARMLLSDFGDAGQGPLGVNPGGVAVEASGQILVVDVDAGTGTRGALFRVDPGTGTRTLLSDFGNDDQGTLGVDPSGVAVEASGKILIIDMSAARLSLGTLVRVDPVHGRRTVLSDFSDADQGPLGVNPGGVAVEASGQILVADFDVGPGRRGALFRVDPGTGDRTILSNFGDSAQGPLGREPGGVAVEADASILVIDFSAGTGNRGALFRINASTGTRTLLSNFGNNAQGPRGMDPVGVAVEADGTILVVDVTAGRGDRGALFRLDAVAGTSILFSNFVDDARDPRGGDPIRVAVDDALFPLGADAGDRALLSDFGNNAQGPLGANPYGVTVR